MTDNSQFGGTDIKQAAKLLGIVGFAISILSGNILGVFIYILVYLGAAKERPAFFLPAKICLIIELILSIFLIILLVILCLLGFIVLKNESNISGYPRGEAFAKDVTNSVLNREVLTVSSIAYFIFTSIIFFFHLLFVYISYAIVSRARNYMLETPGYVVGDGKTPYYQPGTTI